MEKIALHLTCKSRVDFLSPVIHLSILPPNEDFKTAAYKS